MSEVLHVQYSTLQWYFESELIKGTWLLELSIEKPQLQTAKGWQYQIKAILLQGPLTICSVVLEDPCNCIPFSLITTRQQNSD